MPFCFSWSLCSIVDRNEKSSDFLLVLQFKCFAFFLEFVTIYCFSSQKYICEISHKVRPHYSATGGILCCVFYAQRSRQPVFYIAWFHYKPVNHCNSSIRLPKMHAWQSKMLLLFPRSISIVKYVKEMPSDKWFWISLNNFGGILKNWSSSKVCIEVYFVEVVWI